MTSSRWLRVSGFVCALAWGACGSEAPASELVAAGSGGTPDLHVDNPGGAGRLAAGSGGAGTGVAGTGIAGAAGGGAGGASAGAGGSAGQAGGSAAGSSGAGSGGAMAAGSGGAGGVGGAGGAAGAAPDDFFGLFPPPALSCDGLLCLEDADCATLYPDETAACKLTRCVDLFCE